jgi:hypothetical protein
VVADGRYTLTVGGSSRDLKERAKFETDFTGGGEGVDFRPSSGRRARRSTSR